MVWWSMFVPLHGPCSVVAVRVNLPYPMAASDVVVELGCSDARQCTQYNSNNSPMRPGLATVVCVREARSVCVAMVYDEMTEDGAV